MEEILTTLNKKIKSGDVMSPFLLVGKNIEGLNSKIESLSKSILKDNNIPLVYLHILRDNGDVIKIKDIKTFLEPSNSKVPFGFQIFIFENISRLNIASSNCLLKFLEEPGSQNIVFLTNSGESNILDTILSRLNIIRDTGNNIGVSKNDFFQSVLNNYVFGSSNEAISYFFKNKFEKEEYLDFLENMIIFAKENLLFIDLLEELDDDISLIKKNNLNARYITDKWLLKIK